MGAAGARVGRARVSRRARSPPRRASADALLSLSQARLCAFFGASSSRPVEGTCCRHGRSNGTNCKGLRCAAPRGTTSRGDNIAVSASPINSSLLRRRLPCARAAHRLSARANPLFIPPNPLILAPQIVGAFALVIILAVAAAGIKHGFIDAAGALLAPVAAEYTAAPAAFLAEFAGFFAAAFVAVVSRTLGRTRVCRAANTLRSNVHLVSLPLSLPRRCSCRP